MGKYTDKLSGKSHDEVLAHYGLTDEFCEAFHKEQDARELAHKVGLVIGWTIKIVINLLWVAALVKFVAN